ncbi:MAG: arsenite efflux transporter metallochaperone ArsD [Thermosediminibacteraceae bacterium]|uniref:Arsenical resistance operon trans-acting repressor ArsD n=1 Tax=Thermosediminibacter litoriperuensis TaxID=291989 RepID=A0A5S5AEI5_9FIRM|nr:arsenite efflux transporter metallochaperone ArsD [Thermosediminibacter litoriperuensis]MCG0276793.1 arsenite efflux transporter metallochaperone ArsD [Thermosediminibacteraceae bacterium]TYP48137.1 arsenical resistance operon trans-acting repressor ArsD [Thermosediminibacter litoriperuensis]
MKIEFYEPPMCCPTGLCGPTVDEKLVKLNENIEFLKKKYPGIEIQRYMITQQPLKFKENQSVYKLIQDKGKEALPITTFNGEVIKVGEYPSLEEMEKKIEESGRQV